MKRIGLELKVVIELCVRGWWPKLKTCTGIAGFLQVLSTQASHSRDGAFPRASAKKFDLQMTDVQNCAFAKPVLPNSYGANNNKDV